jgi:hypothetical protein
MRLINFWRSLTAADVLPRVQEYLAMTLMQKWFWAIAVIVNPAMAFISYQYWAFGFWVVGALSLYTAVGLYDLFFSRHTLNRLYPVAAYCRYGLASQKWRAPTETGGVLWGEESGLRRSSSARRCAWC